MKHSPSAAALDDPTAHSALGGWTGIDEEPTLPAVAVVSPLRSRNPLILVAERNPARRRDYAARVAALGCRVLTSVEAEATARLTVHTRPDAVLLGAVHGCGDPALLRRRLVEANAIPDRRVLLLDGEVVTELEALLQTIMAALA